MRLKSFRIKNYKSIKDTGDVSLSENNNVFVLAGQNESGKSAILSALSDFSDNTEDFDPESTQYSLEDEEPKQCVECKYQIEEDDEFYNNVVIDIFEHLGLELTEEDMESILPQLESHREFTLIKEKLDDGVRFYIDNDIYQLIKNKVILEFVTYDEEDVENTTEEEENSNKVGSISEEELAEIIFPHCPAITLFDDFCSLLPDRILLSDLKTKNEEAKGYIAVKNLEKILGVDFTVKEQQIESKRSVLQENENTTLSVDFQKDWQQKIYNTNEVKLEYNFQKRNGEGAEGSFIEFYVSTKKEEKLYPHQRSKGLIWFLSFWLELKARSLEENGTVLLLDEPDQHLHIKAQKDMLKLINKLADDGNQVLYSTHLPYLIDIDNLSAVRLVYNSEESGTQIEKLTTAKIDSANKADALKPIADAIGMGTDYFLHPDKDKCIILEGLSDFYYFTAMKQILDPKGSYVFLPATGISKIPVLISFCIGYGKKWKVITDDGPTARNIFQDITESFFDGDATNGQKQFHILNGIKGVENMFDYEDLKLIDGQIGTDRKNKEDVVGKKRKVVFSTMFYERIRNKKIKKEDLSPDTIERFEDVFAFIKKRTRAL